MEKLENFKKKIIYRSQYRGTKEMDMLLHKFVKYYIDELDSKDLYDLHELLKTEDEILFNFINSVKKMRVFKKIVFHYFLEILKFKMAERRELNSRTSCSRCWFSRPVLSTAQPPLLKV